MCYSLGMITETEKFASNRLLSNEEDRMVENQAEWNMI